MGLRLQRPMDLQLKMVHLEMIRVATNKNNKNYVAWQWEQMVVRQQHLVRLDNNTGGTHQANTTGGFSIVFYTGTGAIGTVQHGLGAKIGWMIIKRLESVYKCNCLSFIFGCNT